MFSHHIFDPCDVVMGPREHSVEITTAEPIAERNFSMQFPHAVHEARQWSARISLTPGCLLGASRSSAEHSVEHFGMSMVVVDPALFVGLHRKSPLL